MAHQGSPYQYLENFKKWIREGEHLKKGIPFEEFWTYPYELINAFISIQSGKGLLSPCNQVLVMEPKNIFLREKKTLLSAICDCFHLLKMLKKTCKELVTVCLHYIRVKDASIHGIGAS